MNPNSHVPGKILNSPDGRILRNERNGLTVYDRKEHLFTFFEGIFAEDLTEENGQVKSEALDRLLSEDKERLTKNVQSDSPFNVCWMISGRCNLDCIYCFAEDKMAMKKAIPYDEMATAQHILDLNSLSVVLTGGEPTLNPKLKDVLTFFKGKVGTVLDTNGTTPQLKKLIPVLKDADTTVRLTVDTLDNEILNTVRPRKTVPTGENADRAACVYDQAELLRKNIRALTEAGVPVVIHTVLTRYNIGNLEKTAEELTRFGIRRWHFYTVNYSQKCSAFYEKIRVSRQEACRYTDSLAERFGNHLKITCPANEIGNRERAVLLIDSSGRFCVDTVRNGCRFLGDDPFSPKKEEIMAGLDYELHKQAYLCNFW